MQKIMLPLLIGIFPLSLYGQGYPTQPNIPSYNSGSSMPGMGQFGGGMNVPMPNANGQVQVKLGATAEDIMRQADPNYGANYSNPAENQRRNEAAIRARMAQDPAYNPALRNGVSNNFPINKQEELYNLIKSIVSDDNRRGTGETQERFDTAEFAAKTKSYTDALKTLKNMLAGKTKPSLAEAYFAMENAYGEAYLTKAEFKANIQQSADFIRKWMQENKLNSHDNAAINYAVQQFMGEKLQITIAKNVDGKPSIETISHDPFRYDYRDFTGDKDHRNFFLTKCLATGTGQCNSMPAVYLVLVEAMGGTAYLALAPQHSLVKYPDKKGNIRNYEPTSHWDITDEWYYDNMFISQVAAKNKLYLNPWGSKQVIADIVLQLESGYFRKFGGTDGKFANECLNASKPYFPQNNNPIVYFTLSNQYGYQLTQAMRKNGIDRISNINQSPEAQAIFKKWQANEMAIENLGYQDQPRDMYAEMMKYHEFRGKMQETANFNTKEKRSLFSKTGQSTK